MNSSISRSYENTMNLGRYAAVTALLVAIGLGFILAASLLLAWFSTHVPDWVLSLDVAAYRAIAGVNSAPVTGLLFALFNDPGLDYTFAVAACLCYVWWRRRKDFPWAVAAIILTLVIGSSTMQYMQWYGFRQRPFTIVTDVAVDPYWRQVWQGIPTFPSGHVRELTGLCVVLGYFWRSSRWVAASYAMLVALSRVYLGAHFATDVLAGLFVGICSGGLSVLGVSRVSRIVASLEERARTTSVYSYLFLARDGNEPLPARAVRLLMHIGLLLGLSAAAGRLLHTDSPRILADYLRNTDNSLIAPLFGRFDLATAKAAYPLFGDDRIVYTSLLLLGLATCLLQQKGARVRVFLLALPLCFAMGYLVQAVVAPNLVRSRPLEAAASVPPDWSSLWPGPSSFPVGYLLVLMALCTVVGACWPALAKPLYAYAIVAAIALLYFGATWPTDAIVTLPLGYLFGRCALSVAAGIVPRHWLGNDHLEGVGDNFAGNRRGP